MDSKITRLIEQASVIVGALPYLQAYRDKTFLIKFGGSAMDDPRLVKKLMRDIVLLEALGFNPVIVHGGGKAISKAMMEAGLEAHFINGLRVTTPEAISIVERTLSGTINPGLVQMFRDFGGKGVGIPGTEIFVGERIQEKDEQGNPVDIGEVGNVIGCLTERVTEALELHRLPASQGTGHPQAAQRERGPGRRRSCQGTQAGQAHLHFRRPRHHEGPFRSFHPHQIRHTDRSP